MTNTIVFTSANESVSSMLIEWIISLRKLACYSGEVLVLDYGIGQATATLLSKFDVTLIKCKPAKSIVVARYLDVIPLLKRRPASIFAHFDADIWFQDRIDEIFEIARITDGCLFSADVHWYTQGHIGSSRVGARQYLDKVQRIKSRFNGTIQGGFSCGTGQNLAKRYIAFRALLKSGRLPWNYGSDQFAFNLLFDEENDRADFFDWNGIGADTFKQNGVWWSKRGFPRKLRAVHVVGMLRGEIERRFYHCHKSLFRQTLMDLGCGVLDSVHFKDTRFPTGVPHALQYLILLCRKHRNSAITFGKIRAPLFCYADIGCISFVRNGYHGREHYWDKLKLARRDHIAEPQHLYLSQRAVDVFARIPSNYPFKLCRKFEDLFVDLMLTMMATEHGLSIGPIMR